MFDESFYAAAGVQARMWEILSGRKRCKRQEVSEFVMRLARHLLAHEQSRASVMSVQRNEAEGAQRWEGGRVANLDRAASCGISCPAGDCSSSSAGDTDTSPLRPETPGLIFRH